MNRICPTEEVLSEYLCGALQGEEKESLEKHLAGCASCRHLIAEAHNVIKRPALAGIARRAFELFMNNQWLAASAFFFLLSFIYPKYFLQLLAACLITGAKWVVDSRTSRIMVMIKDAWKSGDDEKADKLISRLTGRK